MRPPGKAGVNVDDIDRAIIEQLQHDGRLPYTKLGAAVGLSEAAVRQRVQRLVDSGVMQVVAVTDPMSLGLRRMAMIGIRCDGDTTVLAERLGSLAEVDYVVIAAGSFDILVEVVVSDDDGFLDLINQIRRINGVVSTESFVYLRIAKQTYEWGAR
jgi:Lrp/AsnC family transcriptional regulator for asnA, asnC and gidA